MPPDSWPSETSLEELLRPILRSDSAAKRVADTLPLSWLCDAGHRELGISKAMHSRLMAALELGRRVAAVHENDLQTSRISGSADAKRYCRQQFARIIAEAKREYFYTVTLNTKNRPIGSHCISIGTLDASLIHPREVLRPAIRDSASSVLLAHNHPSGDPQPSKEDLQVTERLEEAGKLLGIDVLDHIIMARDGCVSIREYR